MNPEIESLIRQFDAVDGQAAELLRVLTPEQAAWSPARNRWSVLECLEHTTIAVGFYLTRIDPAIRRARERGQTNPGPYRYKWFDEFVVRQLEPPYRMKTKTGPMYQPRRSTPPQEVLADYVHAHDMARDALRRSDGLDLAGVRWRHPHLFFLTFSLGSGFATMAAHARRHLWQATQVTLMPEFPRAECSD